jgi:hypothetical protein
MFRHCGHHQVKYLHSTSTLLLFLPTLANVYSWGRFHMPPLTLTNNAYDLPHLYTLANVGENSEVESVNISADDDHKVQKHVVK